VSDDVKLTMSLYGDPDSETLEEARRAFTSLVEAVSDEAVGPGKVTWVARCAWCCNVCGWEAEGMVRPQSWTNDGKYDYCERCSGERSAKW
jgi:hypothetical protein